jgi:chemotaxis protein histidine kinase CheA/ActR/RegA family two-component response regulator
MEISPQLMQQLQVVFKAELAEHLETLTSGLLALEQGIDASQQQELLEEIFRAAHSLKGASKGVSEHAIADITHRLESIFNLLKKGQLPYSTALFDITLQAVDKIKQIAETPETDRVAFAVFLKKLDDCLESNPQSSTEIVKAKSPPPTAAAISKKLPPVETIVPVPANPSSPSTAQVSPTAVAGSTPQLMPVTSETHQQAAYTVLSQDVKHLSLLADEVQTSRLQLKKHLSDFQQLCLNLDYLSNALNEHISYQTIGSRDEKLAHSIVELTHLSANALNSFNNLRQLNNHLHQVSQSLTSSVNTMRLVPFSMLLAPLHRIARDLSQQQQKKLQFVIEGEEIKIDRNLYKVLHTPLVHLINNAIDHGIELPQQRLAEGKSEQAVLRLKISKVAANIVISLSDDGKGIDLEILRQKILKLQLLSVSEVKSLSHDSVLDFIFKPGFSLAPILTETSGRGVGLDVVKTNLRKIKGTISVKTAVKQGTEFTLTLPASLTSESGILIRANESKFALQGYNIERVMDVATESLIFLNGKNLLPTADGQPVNIYYLSQLLGLSDTPPVQKKLLATVLITDGERKIVLIVDDIIGEQDLIIKPFSYPLLSVPFAVGMAILGSGELVPVLQASDLIAKAFNSQQSSASEVEITQPTAQPKILIVDDSPTSRTLEKNILEQQGYQVKDLINGLQAWQELQKNPHYDLIISDIEMPLMNGFELVEKIKNHPNTRDIPTIIVSLLNSEQDKRRGVHVGADAYITKDSFDSHRLLTIINQLL